MIDAVQRPKPYRPAPTLLRSHLLAATLIVTASQRPDRQLGTPIPPSTAPSSSW